MNRYRSIFLALFVFLSVSFGVLFNSQNVLANNAGVTAINVGSQVGSATQGTASSPTFAVSFTRSGNNTSISGLSVSSGLPTGATAVWSSTSSSANGNHDPDPVTLTINTSSGTPAGSYVFTVSSTSPVLSKTGTLTISPNTADTTPPVIASHTDVTAEATSNTGATVSYTLPTATDAVDGTDVVTCLPASGTVFALGNTLITCNASDAAGNAATPTTFNVVVKDTTAPVVTAPTNLSSTEADSSSGVVVTFDASATDLVDGTTSVSCTPSSGSIFPIGITSVDCSSTDSHSNTGHSVFNITVSDTTAPTLALPADFTAEATSNSGANVTFSVGANDLVDGSTPVLCTPSSGSVFPLGKTAVNCSTSDSSANTANGTFNVTVADTTPPVIASHTDVTAEATSNTGATVSYTLPTATDAVDGTDVVTCLPASGTVFALGNTLITCNASDAAGNAATPTTFNVVVKDTTAPVITIVGSDTVNLTVGDSYTDAGATALDTFDGDITAKIIKGGTFVDSSVAGTYTITYDVKDNAGNPATQVIRTIIVSAPDNTGDTNSTNTSTNPTVITPPVVHNGGHGFLPHSNGVSTAPVGQVLGAESFHFTLELKKGAHGDEVTELQKFLQTAGYYNATIDGKFGPKTKTALIKFEIANNLKGDGIVGPLVRLLLNK